MFKSMKMYLKNKLTDSEELTKIRWKLHKFFELNPDVDHYLCDETNRKLSLGLLLGFLVGFAIGVFLILLWWRFQMDYYHAAGYLKVPGSFYWG